jgi:hypothetical protein
MLAFDLLLDNSRPSTDQFAQVSDLGIRHAFCIPTLHLEMFLFLVEQKGS